MNSFSPSSFCHPSSPARLASHYAFVLFLPSSFYLLTSPRDQLPKLLNELNEALAA